MKEDRKVDSGIFDVKEKTLKLTIPTDPPLSLVKEIKGEDSFIGRIKNFFKPKEKTRGMKTIEINIISATPEKISNYFKLIGEIMKKNQEEMRKYADEIANMQEDEFDEIRSIYEIAVDSSLQMIGRSDDMFRLILDNAKLDEFDFIPFLSAEQRNGIISAFYEINPILGDSQKKAGEIAEEVKTEKILSQINQGVQKMKNELEKIGKEEEWKEA